MAKVKRALTALDAAVLLRESLHELEGFRLQKVWMLGEAVVARFREPLMGDRLLVLSPTIGVFETRYELPRGDSHPQLAAALRKLRGARLACIRQLSLDRVFSLVFERGGWRGEVVVEWVREGNIIVLDDQSRVIAALRKREMRDRKIAVGETYVPPPQRGLDPLSLTQLDLPELNSRLTAAALLSRLINAPGELIAEALYRVGADPKAKSSSLDSSLIQKALSELREMYRRALEGYVNPGIAVEREENLGAYPFELKHLKATFKPIPTLSEAVDLVYTPRLLPQPKARRGAAIEAERLASEYAERAAALRRAAEAILSNRDLFEAILEEYRALRRTVPWDSLLEAVKRKYPQVTEVNPQHATLKVLVNGVEVELNARLTAARNASHLFEKAKELERKAERAKEVASEISPPSPPRPALKLRKERKWYEGFHHFVSSEGFLVIGGKDAGQNEAIVKKYMSEKDLFFHADVHGGPVVVVKTEGKSVGEATIKEAAQLAAVYSRAWEIGLSSVDVYWVAAGQVTKKPPAGEYLRKGAFMIYGRRNYLRNVKLELAVGVKVENGECKLLAGPPTAIVRRSDVAVVLEPGRISREEAARKVAALLRSALAAKGFKVKLPPHEVLPLLPRGGFYISGVKSGG